MMGRHAKQNELWSEPVNLARRIPADPLRKLRETIKLEFVREEVAASPTIARHHRPGCDRYRWRS